MTEVTIVAVPNDEDHVWKLSSEKVPHMTLLFLGDVPDEDLNDILAFTGHACITSLKPFGLTVHHRGILGADSADVLFFEKDRSNIEEILEFRSALLKNASIRRAFESVEQYPDWMPHLTMGYPKTPAKEDKRDYPNSGYVHFDRIQVWTKDYDGISFRLEYDKGSLEEVAMSESLEKMLAHYGIKGQRWGVTRNTGSVEVSTTVTPGKKVTAKGGQNQPAHEDAIRTAAAKQKAKASTTDALSTKDLQDLVTRMNLEQQYTKLSKEKTFFDKLDNDKKKADKLLGAAQTANNVAAFVNSPIGKAMKKMVIQAIKK